MGKRRKVRAQRKFAQGAYVPPQSTSLPPPTQGTVNAIHRAVSAPGRVTKNVCSAKDLLTRMSLGKAHHHTVDWPLVILEDCANILNIEPDKKKLGVKKRHNRRLLRNTRKHASDVGDRHSSVSDSGEDTPLSHMQNPQVTPSKVKNMPVGDTEGTGSDTEKSSDFVNLISETVVPKRKINGNTQQNEKKNKFGLDKIVKVVVERQDLNRRKTSIPSPEPDGLPKRRSLNRNLNPNYSSSKSDLPPSSPESDDKHDQRRKLPRTSERCATRSKPTYCSDNTVSFITSSTDQPSKQKLLKKGEKGVVMKKCMRNNIKRTREKITAKKSRLVNKEPFYTKQADIQPMVSIPSDTYNTILQSLVKSNVSSLCDNQEMTTFEPEATESMEIFGLPTSESFKVPSVPARFTKRAKTQCPLRPIIDLHELLSSEVVCNTCRRCTLITMYKKILKNVPTSRGDEPDVQKQQSSLCPYGFDQGSKPYIKRREKVCNVLTSKSLPIWLINFQMDLHVFKVEHRAGTLKRSLKLDPEDAADDLVEKIITRLEYLNRRIIQDNMENLENPDNISIDQVAEASTSQSLFPVVRLISLPEMSVLVGNQGVDTSTDQNQPKQPPLPKENNEPEPHVPVREALVYRPTLEEFKDPITYIKGIEPEASKYGMCKIIPPDDFHVPCHLDENCVFGTTIQHLARLYHRWGLNTREFATIQTYLTSLTPRDRERFTKAPLFGGIEVDLVKLYHLVWKEGGIEAYLADSEKWARIGAQMNFCSKPDWKKLEKIYCKHVLPYESLTLAERQAASKKADKIWNIRLKNAILRARHPLHYQEAMLSESNLPEYEEAFPDADLVDLYNICKPIYDKIEECIGKGRAMNLSTFRRISTQIQGMRFPSGLPSTIAEIESQYWKILNLGDEHVCVLSAFIDTSVNNLGHESDTKKPGGNHPWNLKRIGENPNNILRSLGKALSVTVPTLCLNQLYSTNCWHQDPHKLAWLDYMHEGATKIWYSVADTGAPALRRAVQRLTEAAVQKKGIWLASDTTMIPPGHLMECGVPVQRIEQNPNEYIVVFPGAYACSISTGFSVAESIYFETSSWLDRVEKVFEDMHRDCEPAMFSCVLLMMNMARNPTLSVDVLNRVGIILKRLFKTEFQARRDAQWLNCKVTTDKCGREEGNMLPVSWTNQEECCLCRIPLVLSKMSKYDEPRKQMCISHGTQYMRLVNLRPEAERPEHPPVVTLHYTNQELIEMMGTVELYAMDTE